ncbi:MAG: PQQ-dependent sugar dehydrogenase, partial [Actinomycetota bacterium]
RRRPPVGHTGTMPSATRPEAPRTPLSWPVAATIAVATLAASTLAITALDSSGEEAAPPPPTEVVTEPDAAPDEGPRRLTTVAELGGPAVLAARPGADELVVGTLDGTVRTITGADDEPVVDAEPLLDLRDLVRSGEGEQGLVDLEFSPDGGHLLVAYTDAEGTLVVDGFALGETADRLDPSGAVRILEVPQLDNNHNGGNLAFGPDGALYVGLGDGGADGPETLAESLEVSQDTTRLLGSVLRILPDLDQGGYDVPDDNPYVGTEGRDEIWVRGLRNPFRLSFDDEGVLWVPDVGAADREEINRLEVDDAPGANLGWAQMEGSVPLLDGVEPADHTRPVFEYPHDDGRCAIVGGVLVTGDRYPELAGRYLYSDFCAGSLFAIDRDDGSSWREEVLDLPLEGDTALVSVAAVEQLGGTIYVADLDGRVLRMDGAP